MSIIELARSQLCIYCDAITPNPRKGEHIIPKALGGNKYIVNKSGRRVCETCNNGTLSKLDKELCSRSYVSIVASQEINASLWQVWDIDHSANNELLEARATWDNGELSHLFCYPQIEFATNRPTINGDYLDMEEFGMKHSIDVLVRAARIAYHRYRTGDRRAIIFEPIQADVEMNGKYTFSPRIYTPCSIADLAKKLGNKSFVLRYISANDRSRVLDGLSRLQSGSSFPNRAHRPASRMPTISTYFDQGVVIRQLIKTGINLLAAAYENTPITSKGFSKAIDLICNRSPISVDLALSF